MPTVSVSIRNEDYDKWRALESPAEFIHNALNDIPTPFTQKQVENVERVIKAEPFVPHPPDPELGYPCCQKKTPCKHWVWNDVDSLWQNTLTGKTREE